MTTKKLIITMTAHNKHTQYRYLGYNFTFDDKLRPIPVEVESDKADILLEMTKDRPKCCRRGEPKPLFQEVS